MSNTPSNTPLNTPSFRTFEPDDLEDLEQMIFALYEEDPCGNPITSEKIRWTVGFLADHPDRGRVVVFLVSGKMVGYAIIVSYISNEYGGVVLFIDELYVRKPFRSRGVATSFFDFLSRDQKGKAKAIQIEANRTNERAVRLYRSLGFELLQRDHFCMKI